MNGCPRSLTLVLCLTELGTLQTILQLVSIKVDVTSAGHRTQKLLENSIQVKKEKQSEKQNVSIFWNIDSGLVFVPPFNVVFLEKVKYLDYKTFELHVSQLRAGSCQPPRNIRHLKTLFKAPPTPPSLLTVPHTVHLSASPAPPHHDEFQTTRCLLPALTLSNTEWSWCLGEGCVRRLSRFPLWGWLRLRPVGQSAALQILLNGARI